MKLKIAATLSAVLVLAFQAKAIEPSLDGQYEMKLRTRTHVYTDTMELKGVRGPALLRSFGGNIGGTIVVPGAFTSNLAGTAYCTTWGGFCELRFQIVANEQGKSYRVHYQARLPLTEYNDALFNGKRVVLSGSAFLENGELLGTFQAVQQ